MPRSVPVIAAGVAALLALSGCAASKPRRPSPARDAMLGRPLVLSAPDLEGREVDVAARSGKVRVVDFWASWCEPCRDSMPHLDALARDLGPRGVEVFGVAFDDEAEPVRQFLAELPVGFPVLWDRGGERLSGPLRVARLPTTVVVDRAGVVRWVREGWTPRVGEETREQVEKLLRERHPD